MTYAHAYRRLRAARTVMRTCRAAGCGPPDVQVDAFSPARDPNEMDRIRRESPEPEPWASYLAPYRYDLKHAD